jgi:hypothetical protein
VRENFGVKKVEALSKYSEKSAHKLIFPKTKKNIPDFPNHWYISIFMSHCDQLPTNIKSPPPSH